MALMGVPKDPYAVVNVKIFGISCANGSQRGIKVILLCYPEILWPNVHYFAVGESSGKFMVSFKSSECQGFPCLILFTVLYVLVKLSLVSTLTR